MFVVLEIMQSSLFVIIRAVSFELGRCTQKRVSHECLSVSPTYLSFFENVPPSNISWQRSSNKLEKSPITWTTHEKQMLFGSCEQNQVFI